MRGSTLAVRRSLILASILTMIFSFGHLLISHVAAAIDTGSVTSLIARGGFDEERLSDFNFSEWRPPTGRIRPFAFNNRSYEGYEIIRYRRGSQPHWLVWFSYYEAEYLRPDGKKEIGPAFGPLPYTAPNLLVSIPAVLVGLALGAVGLFVKPSKGVEHAG